MLFLQNPYLQNSEYVRASPQEQKLVSTITILKIQVMENYHLFANEVFLNLHCLSIDCALEGTVYPE